MTIDVAARWPSGTPQGRPLLPSTTLLQPGDPDTSPVRHIIMSHLVFDWKIHSRTVPIQNIGLTRGGKKHVSAQHRLNRFVQDPTLTERCKDLLELAASVITSIYLHTGVSSQDMCWQRIFERVTIEGRFGLKVSRKKTDAMCKDSLIYFHWHIYFISRSKIIRLQDNCCRLVLANVYCLLGIR